MTERGLSAADAYAKLASDHGWDPVHMAIAWQLTRPFKNIPIIGATSKAQLDHMISGFGRELPEELNRGIAKLHRQTAMPY